MPGQLTSRFEAPAGVAGPRTILDGNGRDNQTIPLTNIKILLKNEDQPTPTLSA